MRSTDIDITLKFIEDTVRYAEHHEADNFNIINSLSTVIAGIKEKHNQKQPFHINIVDLLRANENAHSRILCELMRQNSGGRYDIFESFIRRFFPETINIKINKPNFSVEKRRIDMLIREPGKYAIIFENKIHNAVLQKNQLARYVEKMKEEGYSEKQIYVVYLPPDDYNQPTECCWKKPEKWCSQCNVNEPHPQCNDNKSYKDRVDSLSLSYKNDILSWLKDDVLPNCRMKDAFLYTTIFQYTDHLEGMFSLRQINNELNMEVKEHIKKALVLKNDPESDYSVVERKIEDVRNVLNHLDYLKTEALNGCWTKWREQLKAQYPNCKIVGNVEDKSYPNLGIQFTYQGKEFAILIEKGANKIYYGIARYYSSDTIIVDDLKKPLGSIFEEIGGFESDESWYGWKYTPVEDAYKRLTSLIDLIVEKL